MRIRYVLSLLVAVILAVLFAGCGGGGGGGGTSNDLGTLVIDESVPPQWATYVPPTNREVKAVIGYFDHVGSSQLITSYADYQSPTAEYPNGCWQFDLTDTSDQFQGSAIGDYNLTVKVVFADNDTTAVRVGPIYRVQLNVVGDGPPPPPWTAG